MKHLLLALFASSILLLSGCGGGGGAAGTGGGGGGGGGTLTARQAGIQVAQGFFALDKIEPSRNWLFARGGSGSKLGIRNFIRLAKDQQKVGRGTTPAWTQEFDMGLWYQPQTLSSISTRFNLRTDPNNAATGAGYIEVTETNGLPYPVQYEITVNVTAGKYPSTGFLRFTFDDATETVGTLALDFSIAASSGTIRLTYNALFNNGDYSGVFSSIRNGKTSTISNVSFIEATNRIIADFQQSPYNGTITQETIDSSYEVFVAGEAPGQDWLIAVDGNGLVVVTPPTGPTESLGAILSQ